MLLLNINEKSIYRYYHNTINYAKQQIDLYSVLVVIKLSKPCGLIGIMQKATDRQLLFCVLAIYFCDLFFRIKEIAKIWC